MKDKALKAVLISCFDIYDMRLRYVEAFLKDKGFEVEYITTDYDHIKKIKYIVQRPNSIQIEVIPYIKNLSVKRLMSHYFFAKNALKEVNKIKPNLLYVMAPPNSLVMFASRYKKRNEVKLIFDIYDLWPETFPSSKAKKLLLLPFRYWGSFRDNNIRFADMIITECDLYQDVLKEQLYGMKVKTLYLTKEMNKQRSIPCLDDDLINICYLGSINNIIDIQSISNLLSEINKIKPVTLHIIGDGESRGEFINTVKSFGVNVEFYGKIFDENEKQLIFDRCSFGINMLKNSVCVGFTMKSIDYFQAGLPILNSVKADTTEIVGSYGIGYNVTDENMKEIAIQVATVSKTELLTMRKNTKEAFNNLFSPEVFNEKLELIHKNL